MEEEAHAGMALYLPHELARLLNALNLELLAVLRPLNITIAQFRVMQVLQAAPRGVSIGEIGWEAVIEQSTVSRIVDQLEERRLARRARSRANPKVVEVALTRRGVEVMAEVTPQAQAIVADATSVLADGEAAALKTLLSKLFEHVRPQR